MKKNYVFIVLLLIVSYVMHSWTTLAPTTKLVKSTKHINYVELETPIFETFFEIPIQLFSLEKVYKNSLSILANDGVFKSKGSGNWSDFNSWQVLDGGLWRNAILSDGYPGLYSGTNTVTIGVGHTITIATNLVTLLMGPVTVNGTLNLNPPDPNVINLNTTDLIIDGVSAVLNFIGVKARLNLIPNNAVLTLRNGGLITAVPCNNNYEIFINSRKYAACAGAPGGIFTFGEVNGSGTLNSFINEAGPINTCFGNYSFSGGFTGPDADVTYAWKVRNLSTGGPLTTIQTAILANQSIPTSTIFAPTEGGEYIISLEITKNSFTNVETRNITVQSIPTAGTINGAPTICSGGDPAVFTNTVSGTGSGTISYRWESAVSPFLTWSKISGATGATYDAPSGLTATTQYRRITISTLNSVACESSPTATVTVTVQSVPTAGTISASQTICNGGDPVAFTNTASGTGSGTISYRWESAVSPFSTWTPISGVVGPTYDAPSGLIATTSYRRITVSTLNTVFCESVATTPIQVTVTPNKTVGTPSAKPTLCINTALTPITHTTTGATGIGSATGLPAGVIAAFSGNTITISGTPTASGTFNYIIPLTGGCGAVNATGTIIVGDTILPVITCPILINLARNTGVGVCTYTVIGTEFNATATDNCVVPALSYTLSGVTSGTGTNLAGVNFNKGVTTVTWSATDGVNAAVTCNFDVTVNDTTKPVIALVGNASITLEACTDTYSEQGATATDNCSVGSVIVGGDTVDVNTPATYTVRYNVTDANGVAADEVTRTVIVQDTTKPSAICQNITVNLDATGNVTITPAQIDNGSSDTCGIASLALDNTTFGCADEGANTVTLTVTDVNGLTDTCTATVTVQDKINPVITCPTNITTAKTSDDGSGNCTTTVSLGTPTATDNCTTAGNFIFIAKVGGATINPATYLFPTGSTTVVWTSTDQAGNISASCNQTVTVIDNENPTITCPTNITQNVGAASCVASVITPNPITADNCSVTRLTWALTGATTGSSPITGINNLGTRTFNLGTTTVMYTVTDTAGNSVNCSYTVTVTDNIPPTITCPANITQNVGAASCVASVITPNPITADNCSVTRLTWALTGATIASSPITGINNLGTRTFNLGTTTVMYTVTDAAGNSAICSYTVTVIDNIFPTITATANVTTTTSADSPGNCTVSRAITNATYADNCSVAKLTWLMTGATAGSSPTTGINQVGTKIFNIGVTTIAYTVTDASGNPSYAAMTVTVEDNEIPVITTNGNKNVNNDAGTCGASVNVNATAIDNCSVGSPTGVRSDGLALNAVYPIGITTITWNVTDAYGNVAETVLQTVNVKDNELPYITSLPTLTEDCSVTITTAPTSADNCGTVNGITSDITLPYTFSEVGVYTVGWDFRDASGNSKVIFQTVIVTDTKAPVPEVTNLPDVNITGCELLSSGITYPTAIDDCNGTITGVPDIEFPYTVSGLTEVTWTFTDVTGNESIQTQNVILTAENIDGGVVTGYLTADGIGTADVDVDITSCSLGSNEIQMNLAGELGTIVQWEKYEVGDGVWQVIPNTTDSLVVTFDEVSTESTYFKVLVQVGTCFQYSESFYVRALPADSPPILVENLFNICLNQEITLIARSGYTVEENALAGLEPEFETGQFPDKFNEDMWRIDGAAAASHWTANANAGKPTNWAGTNPDLYGAIRYDSGSGKKFGIAQGDYYSDWIKKKQPQVYQGETTLETPIFSLENVSAASLDFDQAYNLVGSDYAYLEISIDGGDTYLLANRLQELIGGDTWDYNHPRNNTSNASNYNFATDDSSFDLTPYIGYAEVRARWTFHGTSINSVWAINGISIPIEPILDQIEWTDGIGNPGEDPLSNGYLETAYTFTPESPGQHEYGATILVDGCRAYDEAGTALAKVSVSYSSAGDPVIVGADECGANTVKLNAYDNFKTANENYLKGAYKDKPTDCTTCDDPGTEDIGVWTVTGSSTCGTGTFSNINDPDAIFTGEVGNYVLTWTVNGCASSVNVEIANCNLVNFDGINDYVDFKKENYDLDGDFSIEVWVKPELTSSDIQTIFSKRNGNNLFQNDGYDLRIQNDFVSFWWNGAGNIISPYKINKTRWYHIAVTFSNNTYKLYIDGILVNTKTGASKPNINNYKALLGAMDQPNNVSNKPKNYFNGWIDELRIWNMELTADQLHQMMNQQIEPNPDLSGNVQGEVIKMDIHGISWSNLQGYYRMDQTGCGYLQPNFGVGVDGKLKNITSPQPQTAPLPYTSANDGDWNNMNTWTQPIVWHAPNSIGIDGVTPIDWNIAKISHNINSKKAGGFEGITLLGLLSDAGELTMAADDTMDETNTGRMLWITHYLKLNGSIDLVGESQLLQKRYTPTQFSESILDAASSGYIERDQQGQKNSYNYNYWSSPVSPQGGATNNAPYAVGSILKDGTDSANPKPITFGDGAYFADAANTGAIKISNRWIWSYNASTPATNTDWQNYYQWKYIRSTLEIKAGEGYTMKGTGGTAPITTMQNYVFVGKPHSGTISLGLAKDQTYLIGNPYPSALDADEFILDNLAGRAGGNIFNGALYFWDHFRLTNNHVLAQYAGGYATYTLIGGVKAIANTPLTVNDGSTESVKVPSRYIPVGQAFFVEGALDSPALNGTVSVDGGTLVFKNSQRAFKREETGTSVFMKGAKAKGTANTEKYVDARPKIRLQFDSPLGYHRPLLVGVDERTTNMFDIGFDAPLNEDNKEDMFWLIGKGKLVIQGVPNFDEDQELPLGIKVDKAGLVRIKIDELENIDPDLQIFIKDKLLDISFQINNQPFEINLDPGNYLDRFSVVFRPQKALDVEEEILEKGIHVFMDNATAEIKIKRSIEAEFLSIELYNMLGQRNQVWKNNINVNTVVLPVNVATGVYLVKINTTNGSTGKKIVIE